MFKRFKHLINPLFPGRQGYDFWYVIFKHSMGVDFFSTQINITPEWMLRDLNGKSTLAEVMTWRCQATSLYLS